MPWRWRERSCRQRHPPPPPLRAVPGRDAAVSDVEHVDFVSFLTQDIPRAKHFYPRFSGSRSRRRARTDTEFNAGQVTLDIFNPSSIGQPFAPSPAGLALRVPDVRGSARQARGEGRRVRRRDDRDGCLHMAFFKDPTETRHAPPADAPRDQELSYSSATSAAVADDEGRALAVHRPEGVRSRRVDGERRGRDRGAAVAGRARGGRGRVRRRGRHRDRAARPRDPLRAADRRARAPLLARRLGREVRRPQRGDVEARSARPRAAGRRGRQAALRPGRELRSRAARSSGAC